LASKASEFGEITQNNGQYAVHDLRPTISVPIESPHATSY